ncbi:precorrin-3B C(17)-methyltransferase [Oscillatoria sp. CS-180]|uniref:precorrin-3B C(17)-methyltransferase n=1 Tax=Oscillatoria sp. CS-180 TaxID=3021720 RepID=UPI00232E83FE|nr:precorrin-3B C(17)-methyltransferase [Oscillatoria sp. CS-180]MDB9525445.1 precorrin-3B C(17)-methyltransferase [Oscillatoria sp. CS-180]
MSSFAAITTTPTGLKTLLPICSALSATVWIPEKIADVDFPDDVSVRSYEGALNVILPNLWLSHDGLIFGLATGAVVRLIAPLLQDKATDPAVVVVDEAGKFVISLCGGHQGGGDRLTQTISHCLNAAPILTGAVNRSALPGVDVLGQPFGWHKGSGDWTGVAAAIARSEPVQVIQEAGSDLWQHQLPSDHSLQLGWPEISSSPPEQPSPQARIWISPIRRRFAPHSNMPKVQWHPRVLWVGIGCERGTSQALMEDAIASTFQSRHLATEAIAGIATLDIKGDEIGLQQLCRDHNWPIRYFSAEDLRVVPVPRPSGAVQQAVGTPSVAEAAATLAALQSSALLNLSDKNDLSSSEPLLCTAKQIFRQPNQRGAVTLAIAQAEREFTDRIGHLSLVGIGPGSLSQITPAAKAAISQADAVIGYGLYIDLIRPLFRPGQIVESMPITQEQQRAERAIALADWGLNVAVISSGDCGIYGMAGLVLETLQARNWNGRQPTVETLPGISALQAAAARIGAPLMHDFCAISLSDLLTPWTVIEKRLHAAATADFVVALYNPRSQKRIEQIAIAQRIFAQHRQPNTPVAIVRSVYRPEEAIVLTTVTDMLSYPIDMLTTVIIGNRSTRIYGNTVITPRGYGVEG